MALAPWLIYVSMPSATSVPNVALLDEFVRTLAQGPRFRRAAILDLAAILVSGVAGSGALDKSFQYALSYICAKFGACG